MTVLLLNQHDLNDGKQSWPNLEYNAHVIWILLCCFSCCTSSQQNKWKNSIEQPTDSPVEDLCSLFSSDIDAIGLRHPNIGNRMSKYCTAEIQPVTQLNARRRELCIAAKGCVYISFKHTKEFAHCIQKWHLSLEASICFSISVNNVMNRKDKMTKENHRITTVVHSKVIFSPQSCCSKERHSCWRAVHWLLILISRNVGVFFLVVFHWEN